MSSNNFVNLIQTRQGLQIACIEEIALNKKWIVKKNIEHRLRKLTKGSYSDYLRNLIKK